ncbi:head GIN domain-containing protein [uncultured Hyphomonas sp.]|uniref:head GIN domain-containing protein n=1 Tax=uncultured Hyphomonas sp. TaxID=225298 RepID=UPI002AAB1D01|nr:head GIN domain-containing protein [uncultured Hyphomonas sp.]
MMKPLIVSTVFAATTIAAWADTTETYDYTGFDELAVSAGVEVTYDTSNDYSVVAEFSDGGPDDMKIRQDGNRLYISRKMTSGWGDRVRVTVRVTSPALNAIEASSGSAIEATGIKAEAFELKISSGASAELSGTCGNLKLKVSSGGDADARDLHCRTLTATASSGGSADAYASESATGKTSSGGSVDVWGNPPDRSANHSISGGSTEFH